VEEGEAAVLKFHHKEDTPAEDAPADAVVDALADERVKSAVEEGEAAALKFHHKEDTPAEDAPADAVVGAGKLDGKTLEALEIQSSMAAAGVEVLAAEDLECVGEVECCAIATSNVLHIQSFASFSQMNDLTLQLL